MFRIRKSAAFIQQVRYHAQDYKARAGVDVAKRFTLAVKEAIHFIRQNPHACPAYDVGEGYEDLLAHQFRKWNVRGFPYVALFRLTGDTIFIEVLYAQKMDIPARLAADLPDTEN